MRRDWRIACATAVVLGIVFVLLGTALTTTVAHGTVAGRSAPARTLGLGIYSVTFPESGLPTGTSWSVSLNGTSSSAVAPFSNSFLVSNGNYSYRVGSVTGYTSSPGSGKVAVNGGDVSVNITFKSAAAAKYKVTFSEAGLPSGTSWSVTLNGSTGSTTAPSSIAFSQKNGTYSYTVGSVSGYTSSPSSGSVTVSGSAVARNVSFSASSHAPTTFTVSFSEKGLPTATTWSVTFNGSTSSTIAPMGMQFSEPNGTYAFRVGSVSGYSATPSSGSIAVSGSNVSKSIQFKSNASSTGYTATFSERGLAAGSTWNVSVNGSSRSASAPTTIAFNLTDGSYAYTVGSVTGYSASPASGSLTVSGGPVRTTIIFVADIQHVVVIVMENYELSSVLSSAPYEHYLWDTYGHASKFYGACHESKPEYSAMTSGRAFTCASFPVESVTNLADLVEQKGLSWGGYFESMPSACDTSNAYPYTIYHNPFLDYSDIVTNTSRCTSHDVNSKAFNTSVSQGTLPTVSFYIPNEINDCHDTTVASCDTWLKGFLTPMLNSTNATVHGLMAHTAFFIVYDEGSTNLGYSVGGIANSWCKNTTGQQLTVCGGQVDLTVVSPYSVGTTYSAYATDYNMESTIEWLFGLGSDGGYDGTASFPSMKGLFSFQHNGVVTSVEPVSPHANSGAPNLLTNPLALPLLGGFATGAIGLVAWTRLKGGRRTEPHPPAEEWPRRLRPDSP